MVSSVVPSVLRMSKASHDIPPVPSPVELWELSAVLLWKEIGYYRLHHPSRGGVNEEGGGGAPIECGWEDVASKSNQSGFWRSP